MWPPEHTGPLVTYLLSDLSRGITGQVIRLSGRRLSVLDHPAVAPPVVERDAWSVADIHDAFEQTLRPALKPIGIGLRPSIAAPGAGD